MRRSCWHSSTEAVLRLIFLFLLANTWGLVKAQTHRQTVYWIRYQQQVAFSPKVYWSNDIDNRRFINPDVQNQLIIHSRLHFKPKKRWDFAGGLTYSLAYAAFPERGYTDRIAELRPVLEASYEHSLGKGFMSHRIRTDYRFFQEDPDKTLLDESFFVLRPRYRLQYRRGLKTNEDNVSTLGYRLMAEIMVNDRANFYDQGRFYSSLEIYVSPSINLEAGYIFIHQRRFQRDEYFIRHVMRFSVIHRLKWPAKS